MDEPTNHSLAKKRITLAGAIAGVLFLALSVIIIRDTNSFTYFSKATNEPAEGAIQRIKKQATPLQSLDDSQKPSCLDSFEYASEDDKDLGICFVQFLCQSGVTSSGKPSQEERISCDTNKDSYHWCSYNETLGKCLSLKEWLAATSRICGCPE